MNGMNGMVALGVLVLVVVVTCLPWSWVWKKWS